jgi:hypothetical protein
MFSQITPSLGTIANGFSYTLLGAVAVYTAYKVGEWTGEYLFNIGIEL